MTIPDRERPNDATLAEWIRHCKRSGLYEQGKALYEKGGLNPDNLSDKGNRIRNFYTLKPASEFEADLASVCTRQNLKYTLTNFSGAARLAPAVRQQKIIAYVEESKVDLASLLALKEVPSGANVSLLTPYDEGVFYGVREIDGIRIASPIQIYLDLLGSRGRGEEAAAALLKEVIRHQW